MYKKSYDLALQWLSSGFHLKVKKTVIIDYDDYFNEFQYVEKETATAFSRRGIPIHLGISFALFGKEILPTEAQRTQR
jgi:hypothetical protein